MLPYVTEQKLEKVIKEVKESTPVPSGGTKLYQHSITGIYGGVKLNLVNNNPNQITGSDACEKLYHFLEAYDDSYGTVLKIKTSGSSIAPISGSTFIVAYLKETWTPGVGYSYSIDVIQDTASSEISDTVTEL